MNSKIQKIFSRPIPLQFQHFHLSHEKEITLIRDDLLPLGLGTKLRKLEGVVSFLKENQIHTVHLFGSLHGNFLASFAFILRSLGFQIHTTAYTRDLKLKTANRILTERSSHQTFVSSNRKEALSFWENIKKNKEGHFYMPEFGFHFSSLEGLHKLWEKLEEAKKSPFILWLDIGSGLSFLSAISYFSNKPVELVGVMIGEKENTWMSSLPGNLKTLQLDAEPLSSSSFRILSPKEGKGFANSSKEWKSKVKSMYQNQGLLLEPIYSAKTWSVMEDVLENRKQFHFNSEFYEKEWVYLHQGGLLNHLDPILDL